MERLTTKCTNGGVMESNPRIDYEEILNRLAEYEELEEQGRLLKLGCKEGDVAYVAEPWGVEQKEVKTVCIEINTIFTDGTVSYHIINGAENYQQRVFNERAKADLEYEKTYGRWKNDEKRIGCNV